MPPNSHIIRCTPINSNSYQCNSLAAAANNPALYMLLTFHVPNEPAFYRLLTFHVPNKPALKMFLHYT